MTEHQLSKQGDRWQCPVCQLDWKSKPQTLCQGVPVYTWSNCPSHLLTEDELMAQNLKPTAEPVATRRIKGAPYYADLYDRNQAEVAIPDLPPISDRSEQFAQMKTVNQLERWNLKPGKAQPAGCYWSWRDSEWIYLYRKEDCEISDPTLPPCFDRDAVPPELKTQKQLERMNLTGEGIQPQGCYRYWSQYSGWNTELLWHPADCQWQQKDRYITKTTLKRTYLLSDRWIAQIGDPDRITDNPHHEKWSEMKLYSRQRVEAFLAENADEYAQWISERDRYIAIFEQNREAIEAGRRRAIANRRAIRQAELETRLAQAAADYLERQQRLEQLRREQEERWERDEPRRAQMARCLRCASGCAMSAGFVCAIHPLGLEDNQIPCPDWTAR